MEAAIDGFLPPRRADAVPVHSDLAAAFLPAGLAARGVRVPDDLAVISDDNSDFASALRPPLASVDLAAAAKPRRANPYPAVWCCAPRRAEKTLPPRQKTPRKKGVGRKNTTNRN